MLLTEGFPVFTFDPPTRENPHHSSGRWVLRAAVDARRALRHAHSCPWPHPSSGVGSLREITPDELIVPIVVIDISERAARDSDTLLTVDDLRRFERRNGRIPNGALVRMDSGWAAKVGDPLAYKGGPAFPDYHFPGFDLPAAMWLAEHRDVAGLPGGHAQHRPGQLDHVPGPRRLFRHGRYGVENLNNLDRIPPRGAVAYVGLIPLREGSGGPSPSDSALVAERVTTQRFEDSCRGRDSIRS